jgi:hypothetical protein
MKVFYKHPFIGGYLQNQGFRQVAPRSGALIQNSLLLSSYQRKPGGIYDTLSGF